MNKLANHIIKKDISLLFKNKKLVPIMCIIPIVLAIVIPIVFIVFVKSDTSFDKCAAIFGKAFKTSMDGLALDVQRRMVVEFFLYKTLPIFFAIIPALTSTIIAANSFIGEKESGTLETLFFSPIRARDIFIAKVRASLFLSMGLCTAVFILMCVVLNIVLFLNGFAFFVPNSRWFFSLFVFGPAITILSTTLIIKKSESSTSVEEAQQITVFVMLPIVIFLAGQFRGVISINDSTLIVVSVALLGVSIMAMKIVSSTVDYHT